MREHLKRRFVPALVALVAAGQAMAMVAPPSIAERPGCRGALGSQDVPACRLATEIGAFDPASSNWLPSGQSGATAAVGLGYVDQVLVVRAPTPLGASGRGGDVTYDVHFNAGVYPGYGSASGAVRATLWLGDDQGQFRLPLVERTVTLGGDASGPVRFSVSGQNIGFEPSFLYVELRGTDGLGDKLGGATFAPVIVEGVHVGIRPTASR